MSSLLHRLAGSPGPSVGLEIAAHRVTGAVLTWTKSVPRLVGHASVPLPEGAVVPTAAATNIIDRGVVADAVSRVLAQLPGRAHRIGLVVPDSLAKVSLVHFDNVPVRAADLERLIMWQVRKAVPFKVEDAQLAYSAGGQKPDGSGDFVVAMIRRDIVEEYENVCTTAGAHAGVVDLASFNLVNAALLMAAPSHADWLLVHVASESSTLVIVRRQELIFFRNRPTRTAGDLADLVHQTAMYYEDRLEGRGLARTVLVDSSGATVEASAARGPLEDRLGTVVEPLASGAATSALGLDAGALGPLAAPIGLIMREHMSAA